jgi:hypothetical protein
MPGPPGSAPLLRGCHVPHRSTALKALSGPRAGVPTAPFQPRRCRCPNRLAPPHLARSDRAAVCVRSSSLSGRLRRREHAHGERSRVPPSRCFRPWSVELTSPSLLPVTGPPPATVSPPHRKNAAAEPVFSPSPSTRSFGELSPPPLCLAGSLTGVGARPPPFAPPPPLWRRRRPCCDACPERGDRSGVRRSTPRSRGPHRPSAAPTGRARVVNASRARCARGPSRHREHGPSATVQLGRVRFRPSDTRISFSNFRI